MKKLLLAVPTILLLVGFMVQHPTHAQTAINPSAFALPLSDFPQPANLVKSQVESNTQIQQEQLIFHLGAKSFADEGRTTGYFMEALQPNLDSAGNSHAVLTYYLVSLFPNSDQALAAFQQQQSGWQAVVSHPTSQITAKAGDLGTLQVGDAGDEALYSATAATALGSFQVSELLFKRGAVLVEVWQGMLAADAAQYGPAAAPYLTSIAQKLDAIASGTSIGTTTPGPVTTPTVIATATPTPVDFAIHALRVEKPGSKPDFHLKRKPLKKARAGSSVLISTYVVVKSAPPSAPVTIHFKVKVHGHITSQKVFHETLAPQPIDVYRFSITLQSLVPGKHVIMVHVTISGVTHSRKTKLNVVGRAHAHHVQLREAATTAVSAARLVVASGAALRQLYG